MSVPGDNGARRELDAPPVESHVLDGCREPTVAERDNRSTASTSLRYPDDLGWKEGLLEVLGQVIDGKYRLLEVVGTGGMGAVFKAHNRITNSGVAVKVLHPHLANDAPSLRRFQLEAKAASRIEHRNSVSVHDYGVWEGQAYLVMDYLEGRSLSQMIKENKKLAPAVAVPIFMQACDGLAAAHNLGIYHRDVKPSNLVVMKETDGINVKVCDFGLVKLKVQEGDTITGTGEVFGSPPYMSPEQCMGRTVDERCDIYSLGILMFETLMGYLPIKGKNPLETMRKQVSAMPPSVELPDCDSAVSYILRDIVRKALAKDSEARFQSMNELKDALSTLGVDPSQITSERVDIWSRPPLKRFNFFEHSRPSMRKPRDQ
jgi:serine/threonine protein kinase